MANALQWNGFTPIPPVTPTNGGIASILLLVPDNSVPSAYQSALDYAGLSYQFFTDQSLFNAALAASTPASTLAIVDSIDTTPNFSPLISFVAAGGPALQRSRRSKAAFEGRCLASRAVVGSKAPRAGPVNRRAEQMLLRLLSGADLETLPRRSGGR